MKEHGGIIIGGMQVASTLQCPHCGGHFESIPGSGKRRTFCLRCQAVTCGNPACDACIPVEAKLEFAEGRRTSYDAQILDRIRTGASIL